MERTAVNPVPWSEKLGFDQCELVEGHERFAPQLLVMLEATAMD
jgi:hypothetical protein